MSSKQTAPYTIPYTGAHGKQVAEAFIPASSQEPAAVAHPAAPQDKKSQKAYQRPSIAEKSASPNIAYSKGESKTMFIGSDGNAATSDPNSASRRSSVVPTTFIGPSDSIPNRFTAASACTDGIAIIHPEHRGSCDIHSSQTKEDKRPKNQDNHGAASFGLDGASDDPSLRLWSTPTRDRRSGRDASPMLIRELQAVRQENLQLRHMNACSTAWTYQWYAMWANSASEIKELKSAKNLLTSIILRLQHSVNEIDPDVYHSIPDGLKDLVEDVREEWKYDEWYKAFIDPASDNYVPHNYTYHLDSDLDEAMCGLGIHDASGRASPA